MIRRGKNLILKLFIRSILIYFLQQKSINNFKVKESQLIRQIHVIF